MSFAKSWMILWKPTKIVLTKVKNFCFNLLLYHIHANTLCKTIHQQAMIVLFCLSPSLKTQGEEFNVTFRSRYSGRKHRGIE